MVDFLVVGATGLLGATLVPSLKEKGASVLTLARSASADLSVDICNFDDFAATLAGLRPRVLINLVSMTSVEACEQSPNSAYLANAVSVENAARWIAEYSPDTHLIQISTDHVYDGLGPHLEDDLALRNMYAVTKRTGELMALTVPSTILRTNFVGKSASASRESLTDWVYNSLKRKEHVQVLSDVFFSPLAMSTLCESIILVAGAKRPGIYNLGSKGGMSKAQFDFSFAGELGLDTRFMTPLESSQAKFLKAPRPKDMIMDVTKFEETFDVTLPTLHDEIRKVADEYR